MALSSSEHELLTATCTNMNVATNTCREVLEMLRNLGNTGVVDIATHNNTPGAHADDATLVHASAYGTGASVALGSNDGLPYAPLLVNVRSIATAIAMRSYTHGESGATSTGSSFTNDRFLSDSSNTKLSFENSGLSGQFAIHFSAHRLRDKDDGYIYAGFHYYAGKIGNDFTDGNVPQYGSIRPTLTSGTLSAFTQPIEINSDGVIPRANNVVSLGISGKAWKDAFLVNSPTITSDRRAKKDISSIGSQAVEFIKALRPVSYRLKQGEGQLEQFNEDGPIPNSNPDREGVRTHWGLIAQEVKEALSTAGYEDVALWCLEDKNDLDSKQSLRYEELIAPMIKVIQNQQERIEALERKVA